MRQSIAVILLSASVLVSQFSLAQSRTLSDINNNAESTSNNDGSVQIIDPKKDVPIAKSAAIDTEKFELGLFLGVLSVEDFNSNPVFGISFSYHLTPSILLQLNYGESEVDRATFEDIANDDFVSDSGRTFEYYNFLAGYRVLRGRSFFGVNKKYNSDIYLLAGLGSVDFVDNAETSFVIGSSYRVVLTDWAVANFDIRGHSVDRDFLNDNKRTFNAEYLIGFNFLF